MGVPIAFFFMLIYCTSSLPARILYFGAAFFVPYTAVYAIRVLTYIYICIYVYIIIIIINYYYYFFLLYIQYTYIWVNYNDLTVLPHWIHG